MDYLNSYAAICRVSKEPDIRYIGNGSAVCKFTVSIPYGKTSMFVFITAWEELAEKATSELRKGMKIKIEGKLSIRKYTDRSGIEKYSTEIVLNEYQILERNAA